MSNDAQSLDSFADALLSKHTATESPKAPAAKAAKPAEETGEDETDELDTLNESDDVEESDGQEDETDESEKDEADEESPDEKAPKVDEAAVVKLRLGNEDVDVTVAELKRGYLRTQDYTRKTQEVAEARKEFVATAKEYESTIRTQLDEVGFLAQNLLQQLVAEEKGTDWQKLRQTNPAEWAAKQHDLMERRTLLQRAYQAHQASQTRVSAIGTEEQAAALQAEAEKLPVLIPEWIDARVRTNEQKALAKYLIENGVDKEDVASLSDALTVKLMRKAMLYDQQQAARSRAVQKLKKPVPQFQKPGTRDPNPIRSANQQKTVQARKSGRVEDFAEALASKYR